MVELGQLVAGRWFEVCHRQSVFLTEILEVALLVDAGDRGFLRKASEILVPWIQNHRTTA